MNTRKTIFLSHSSRDKVAVRRLAQDLQKAGFSVWLDELEIMVGDSIIEKIGKGLNECEFVAIWLTKYSVDSGWVQKEWYPKYHKEIESKKIHVLPLLAEKCDIPIMLIDKRYANFVESYEIGLEELIQTLTNQTQWTLDKIEQYIKENLASGNLELKPFNTNREDDPTRIICTYQTNGANRYILWEKGENKITSWDREFFDPVRWFENKDALDDQEIKLIAKSLRLGRPKD